MHVNDVPVPPGCAFVLRSDKEPEEGRARQLSSGGERENYKALPRGRGKFADGIRYDLVQASHLGGDDLVAHFAKRTYCVLNSSFGCSAPAAATRNVWNADSPHVAGTVENSDQGNRL